MTNVKPYKFPMDTKANLHLDPEGKEVDQKLYRSMIGSLLYLCASRPDIMFSRSEERRVGKECRL